MTLQIGIILALASAVTTNLAFLLKHRGACAAPEVSLRHPIKSATGLFKSKWFAIGWVVAFFAWLLHVGALALAPLSLVQSVLAGGLVFLTVLADRFFGADLGLRQWAGVAMTAIGLALLVVTLPASTGVHSGYSVAGMIAFEAGLLSVGAMLVFNPRFGVHHEHHGVLMGVAAGILFGVSGVAVKALTGSIGSEGLTGVLSPWAFTALTASVLAFYASARGLQQGEAVPVITLTSAAANISAIGGGIIVFGDPMPSDPVGVVIQSVAFILVIAAAALIPAPAHAAEPAAARA